MSNETTEQKKKNDSIENSVEKCKVRTDLAIHKRKVAVHLDLTKASLLSLPAEKAHFEHTLVHNFKREGIDIDLSFIGVEKNFSRAIKTFKNMPANSQVVGDCTIEDFLQYEHNASKSGAISLTDIKRATPLMFDFIWLDYCMLATEEGINHLVKCMLENIDKGYIAVTWDLSTRHMKPCDYAKEFSGYKKGMSLREAVVATIAEKLKKIGKEINLAYNVVYGGGDKGITTMLTLGYTVGIPKGVIKPIEENFRDGKNEVKMSRAGMVNKFKTTGKWEIGHKKNVVEVANKKNSTETRGRPRIYASTEERDFAYAVKKYEGMWKNMTRDFKIRVATRYGKSLREFACCVACKHGKLAERLAKVA